MTTYERICEAVRTAFPPNRKIVFSPGESLWNGNLMLTFVWATVSGDSLGMYDQPGLLKLIDGKLEDEATTTDAVIVGRLDGDKYRLHLKV